MSPNSDDQFIFAPTDDEVAQFGLGENEAEAKELADEEKQTEVTCFPLPRQKDEENQSNFTS